MLLYLCVSTIRLTQQAYAVPVVEEKPSGLGPKVAEGELVFGVAHIFASFNDTFVVSLSVCCC